MTVSWCHLKTAFQCDCYRAAPWGMGLAWVLRVAESPNAVLIQLVSDGPWIHISDSLRGGSAAAQGALFENTLPFLEIKRTCLCYIWKVEEPWLTHFHNVLNPRVDSLLTDTPWKLPEAW